MLWVVECIMYVSFPHLQCKKCYLMSFRKHDSFRKLWSDFGILLNETVVLKPWKTDLQLHMWISSDFAAGHMWTGVRQNLSGYSIADQFA